MAKFREFQQWRKKMGWTQAELGAKLDPPRVQHQISDWERLGEKIPSNAMAQLRDLGYDGPDEPEAEPLTRQELEEVLAAQIAVVLEELRSLRAELKKGGR